MPKPASPDLLFPFLLPGGAVGLAVVTRGHPGARYHLIFSARGGGARGAGTWPTEEGEEGDGAGGAGTRAGRRAAAGGSLSELVPWRPRT